MWMRWGTGGLICGPYIPPPAFVMFCFSHSNASNLNLLSIAIRTLGDSSACSLAFVDIIIQSSIDSKHQNASFTFMSTKGSVQLMGHPVNKMIFLNEIPICRWARCRSTLVARAGRRRTSWRRGRAGSRRRPSTRPTSSSAWGSQRNTVSTYTCYF